MHAAIKQTCEVMRSCDQKFTNKQIPDKRSATANACNGLAKFVKSIVKRPFIAHLRNQSEKNPLQFELRAVALRAR